MSKRSATMDLALSLLAANGGTKIVETGCAHSPGDWEGAGLSTVVFGEWAAANGGHLTSVDIDPGHLAVAKALASGPITYVLGDSVRYLLERTEPIDLLYLDSLDYPYGTLLDAYGGQADLEGAIEGLAGKSESTILAEFGDVIAPSQRHARAEFLAALPLLPTLVLIDDAALPGGGKARLAREALEKHGWHLVLDAYQTLWSR